MYFLESYDHFTSAFILLLYCAINRRYLPTRKSIRILAPIFILSQGNIKGINVSANKIKHNAYNNTLSLYRKLNYW